MTAGGSEFRADPNDTSRPKRGLDEAALASSRTVYRDDLLAGQSLLITGGSSGMGKAAAYLAVRLGADVTICGRSPEKLEATRAAILRDTGREILTFPMSIRDPDAVEALIGRGV